MRNKLELDFLWPLILADILSHAIIGSESDKLDRLYVECENLLPGTYYISIALSNQELDLPSNKTSKILILISISE